MKPNYEPKLFGVPMEWDDENDTYKRDYGAITAHLIRDDRDGTFLWQIENLDDHAGNSLEEAEQTLEDELTAIREAIPVRWEESN